LGKLVGPWSHRGGGAVWRRQRWSFTAAFTDGNDDAMTDSGAYMLLWLEEGEGVRRGWSIENEGAQRGAHR
jgi:hypothetical protein